MNVILCSRGGEARLGPTDHAQSYSQPDTLSAYPSRSRSSMIARGVPAITAIPIRMKVINHLHTSAVIPILPYIAFFTVHELHDTRKALHCTCCATAARPAHQFSNASSQNQGPVSTILPSTGANMLPLELSKLLVAPNPLLYLQDLLYLPYLKVCNSSVDRAMFKAYDSWLNAKVSGLRACHANLKLQVVHTLKP